MKTNNSYFSRILVILIAVMMVFTMMPSMAFADVEGNAGAEATGVTSTPTTAKVNFTAQAAGAFLIAPQFGVEVSSDLAESYGYTDQVTDGVSALDVLVKAHEMILGEEFTSEKATEYLSVAESGWVSSALFGNFSFAINGECPNDGVWNDNYKSYTGYLVN